jgi:hypothetical protein
VDAKAFKNCDTPYFTQLGLQLLQQCILAHFAFGMVDCMLLSECGAGSL